MDPRYTAEILRHLEKQKELLTESHSSMSNELHKLQVEEEMLMRKFYQLMKAHGLNQKDNINDNSTGTALVGPIGNEDDQVGSSPALVCPNRPGTTVKSPCLNH